MRRWASSAASPATLVDLLFDEVAAAPDLELRENLREVRNYAAALQYGVERLAEVPLDSRLVLELHERPATLRRPAAPRPAAPPSSITSTSSWT
jgi:hypothetical protein